MKVKTKLLPYALLASLSLISCATASDAPAEKISNKEKVIALLEGLETGDPTGASYIHPEKYIQHNLGVADGPNGFAELMKNAPEGGFKAKVVRAFEDGDYVVTHMDYDFFGPKVGFDVLRLEDGKIVEHWDNLTAVAPKNPSGRTQIDGETSISDIDKTDSNKQIVTNFVNDILMGNQGDKITDYISTEKYLQHNSMVADGLDGLGNAMAFMQKNNFTMQYDKVHKVLGQGNFVLTISEGKFGENGGEHVAFYDLFRLENDKIVEHWDVIEAIPPQSEWKNSNGKFGFR